MINLGLVQKIRLSMLNRPIFLGYSISTLPAKCRQLI